MKPGNLCPKGYKLTEVGVIPDEWDVMRFCEIGKLSKGKGLLKDDIKRSGSIPAIPYTALYTDYSEVLDYTLIKWFIDDESQSVIVSEPCLLFASSSNMEANTGKASALIGDTPVAIGREIIIFKTSSDCKFISYLLSTPTYRKKTLTLARGTTIKHVYPATFQGYQVALPPLPEQRAIATTLSDVDGLLGGLDRLIAKKRDLKQAAMQQLITGQTRLPGFSGEWEVKRLGDIGDCLRGVTYKGDSDLSPYDTAHTKRLLRSNNVQNATVVTTDIQFVNAARVSENQLLRKDDILICMANGSKALVGKAGLFTVSDGCQYTFGAFMGCFRSNSVESNSTFVFFLFQTGRYRNYINNLLAGSSINNLNPSSIESLEFPIPLLPEQTAIATVLSEMDAELAALEARRDKTRALKQGMMQELLTGRIRLV
jgi:type I restriction enzyme S subunit